VVGALRMGFHNVQHTEGMHETNSPFESGPFHGGQTERRLGGRQTMISISGLSIPGGAAIKKWGGGGGAQEHHRETMMESCSIVRLRTRL
jgi:hypothetical protein